MKNKNTILALLVFTFVLVFLAVEVKAEEDKGLKAENMFQVGVSNQGEDIQIQVQNEGQIQAQNENRVESKVQVRVEGDLDDDDDGIEDSSDSLESEDESEDEEEDEKPSKSEKAENRKKESEERKSSVALAVQEMLLVADRTGGIGEQVRVVAQNQVQVQAELENKLENIEKQSSLSKFLFGPKYSEIKVAKEILVQNREQITQLNQVQVEITNEADQKILMEQIELLERASMEIEASLDASEEGFSLFGWLAKVFVK